jgi:hypothetical protein
MNNCDKIGLVDRCTNRDVKTVRLLSDTDSNRHDGPVINMCGGCRTANARMFKITHYEPTESDKSKAIFSDDRRYRYTLHRDIPDSLPSGKLVMFIGLNPSTADEFQDDPTIRRCINFGRDWGYSRFVMTNLFAYRATNPDYMVQADDPIGPDNDKHLIETALFADLIVAAWGAWGSFRNRDADVLAMLHNVHYLDLTRKGQPRHPLYLPGNLTPKPLLEAVYD